MPPRSSPPHAARRAPDAPPPPPPPQFCKALRHLWWSEDPCVSLAARCVRIDSDPGARGVGWAIAVEVVVWLAPAFFTHGTGEVVGGLDVLADQTGAQRRVMLLQALGEMGREPGDAGDAGDASDGAGDASDSAGDEELPPGGEAPPAADAGGGGEVYVSASEGDGGSDDVVVVRQARGRGGGGGGRARRGGGAPRAGRGRGGAPDGPGGGPPAADTRLRDNLRDEVLALIRPDGWVDTAPQPAGMKLPLFRYQRRALSWMLWRETGSASASAAALGARGGSGGTEPSALFEPVALPGGPTVYVNGFSGAVSRGPVYSSRLPGGCLCDEMGLGKTAEVIGLVLSRPRPPPGPPARAGEHEQEREREREGPGSGGQGEGGGAGPGGAGPGGARARGAGGYWEVSARSEAEAHERRELSLAPTLVVVPPNLVAQWVAEIGRFSDLEVVTYEGWDAGTLDGDGGGGGGAPAGGRKRRGGGAWEDDVPVKRQARARRADGKRGRPTQAEMDRMNELLASEPGGGSANEQW